VIPYTIVSVSDARVQNVINIKNCFENEETEIKSFNISIKEDVDEFKNKFPDILIDNYLVNKKYITGESRYFGEIGCWMSHISIWDYVIKNDLQSIIVIEDDCEVNQISLFNFMEVINDNHDIVMGGEWAESYFVTNRACRYLMENAYEQGFKRMPVDEYMFDSIKDGHLNGVFGLNLFRQIFNSEINFKMIGN